jgi:hypothetical protein
LTASHLLHQQPHAHRQPQQLHGTPGWRSDRSGYRSGSGSGSGGGSGSGSSDPVAGFTRVRESLRRALESSPTGYGSPAAGSALSAHTYARGASSHLSPTQRMELTRLERESPAAARTLRELAGSSASRPRPRF